MSQPNAPTVPNPNLPPSLSEISTAGSAGVEMLRTASLIFLAFLGTLVAMWALADVLVPFVLAVFLALLLNPLIDLQVRRMRWPRPIAVGATFLAGALLAAGIIAVLIPAIFGAFQQFQHESPAVEGELSIEIRTGETVAVDIASPPKTGVPNDIQRAGLWLLDRAPFALSTEQRADAEAELASWNLQRLTGLILPAAGAAGGQLLGLLGTAGLVLVFLLFLLLGRGDHPVPPESLRGQVERRIQAYIAITFLTSAGTGLLVGVSLWLLGVKLAWLFGVLAFLLNFIPNIGSVIATLLPLPVIAFDPSLALWAKIAALAIPGTIQFVVGNVVAPKMLGDRLQLSPVAVLFALILLGAIWGLPGMILATPMLATLKLAIERVPLLVPVARLMGGGAGPEGAQN